jgi:hypothetical protein
MGLAGTEMPSFCCHNTVFMECVCVGGGSGQGLCLSVCRLKNQVRRTGMPSFCCGGGATRGAKGSAASSRSCLVGEGAKEVTHLGQRWCT